MFALKYVFVKFDGEVEVENPNALRVHAEVLFGIQLGLLTTAQDCEGPFTMYCTTVMAKEPQSLVNAELSICQRPPSNILLYTEDRPGSDMHSFVPHGRCP
jgi:hypothetical protein